MEVNKMKLFEQIELWISTVSVEDLLDSALESDLVYDYLSSVSNYKMTVIECEQLIKSYCKKQHKYKFRYRNNAELFPLIQSHCLRKESFNYRTGMDALMYHTTLSPRVCEKIVCRFFREEI